MLMIRFQRIGRRNDPAFRIVVLEKERAAKAGNIVELLGTYNPRSKALTLDEEQAKHWISMGAQPTDSINNLLVNKGIITGKKINVLQKHTPQVKEAKGGAAAAAAPVVVDADAGNTEVASAPTEAEPAPEAASAPEVPTDEETPAV